jgi:putative FmdB family regulatory protein
VPTYQYVCTECGGQLEAVQKFTDDALTVHDDCGGRLRKVFSPVGIVFKGSGFYRTDSRNTGSSSSLSASKSGGESSGDSAAAESSKGDSAKASTESSSGGSSAKASGDSAGSAPKKSSSEKVA